MRSSTWAPGHGAHYIIIFRPFHLLLQPNRCRFLQTDISSPFICSNCSGGRGYTQEGDNSVLGAAGPVTKCRRSSLKNAMEVRLSEDICLD
jgi:hypothetical protein